MSEPTDHVTGGVCDPGYGCFGGSPVANPSGVGPTAGVGRPCVAGTYCGAGSSFETGCAPGTYNPTAGAASCVPCPAGQWCGGNGSAPGPCPLGGYCTQGGATLTPCPPGRFGNAANLSVADQCAYCPPGQYCLDGWVTGECAGGYLCYFGVGVPDPEVEVYVNGSLIGGEFACVSFFSLSLVPLAGWYVCFRRAVPCGVVLSPWQLRTLLLPQQYVFCCHSRLQHLYLWTLSRGAQCCVGLLSFFAICLYVCVYVSGIPL